MTANLLLYLPVIVNTPLWAEDMIIFSTILWFPVSLLIKNLKFNA